MSLNASSLLALIGFNLGSNTPMTLSTTLLSTWPLSSTLRGVIAKAARSSQGPAHRKATPLSRSKATPRSRDNVLMAYSAVTMGVARAQAHCDNAAPTCAHRAVFDSDSYAILVDGGATASITNNLNDFVKPPQKTSIRIKGFNGTSSNARVGTIKWTILDDHGVHHVLNIPDTYYVESCPMRLLSPQHYSQQIKDHQGTYSTNYGDRVLFVFHKRKFHVTMTLSSGTNVGILHRAPGHQVFACFVEQAKPAQEPPRDFLACQVISDEDADNMELQEETESVDSTADPTGLGGVPSSIRLPRSFRLPDWTAQ
jgi:hypothetical protein